MGFFVLLALVAGLVWMISRPRHPTISSDLLNPDIDYQELHDAESDLRDIDAQTSAEEAEEEDPDWGPGVPRHR